MTLKQALEKGIKEVRTEPWNPYSRLELPVFWRDEEGKINREGRGKPEHGVVAHLIDPCGNFGCGNPPEHKISIILLSAGMFDLNADGWEEWKRPDDYDQKFPKEEVDHKA